MDGNDNYGGSQNPVSAYGNKNKPSDQGYADSKSPSALYAGKNDPGSPDAGSPPSQSAAPPTLGLGNGVNLQPSYSNNGDADLGWSLMKSYPNIRTVRIEIEPGQQTNAVRWIKEAVTNGYKVIATYHDKHVLDSDDPKQLQAAVTWWRDNYSALSNAGPFLVNLMNEWGTKRIKADAYAAAYNSAIDGVRAFYSGPIILDLPGAGQGVRIGTQAVNAIKDPNIVLSAHIYPLAFDGALDRYLTAGDFDVMAATGRACMIGEFGNFPKGPVPWENLVDYARSLRWPVIGWAWGGDNSAKGGSGNMNMIQSKSGLMASMGQFDPYSASAAVVYTEGTYFKTIYEHL